MTAPHVHDGLVNEPGAEEDYASVRAAGRILHRRGWSKEFGLNEQLGAWSALIDRIESGYTLTVDDYTNDLAVRGWLEEARPLLTEKMRHSLEARLGPLDERFLSHTREPRGAMPGAGEGWWFRLPRLLVGELAEDAIRMNLAQP